MKLFVLIFSISFSIKLSSQTTEALNLKDVFKIAIIQKGKINKADVELYNGLILKAPQPENEFGVKRLEERINKQVDSFKNKIYTKFFLIGFQTSLSEYDFAQKCFYINLKNEDVHELSRETSITLNFLNLDNNQKYALVMPEDKAEELVKSKTLKGLNREIYLEYEVAIDTKISNESNSNYEETNYDAFFRVKKIQVFSDRAKKDKLSEINAPSNDQIVAPVGDGDKIFTVVQIPAEYPGGFAAWNKYLERNLNMNVPKSNGAPAGMYKVVLSFVVDKNGSISEINAENDPGYGTKEEAIRVLKKGGGWKPAVQNGRNIIYRHRQIISFQVSEE